MRLSDPQRRAIRTFLQIGVVEALLLLLTAFGVPLTKEQHGAILMFATPFLVLIQNMLEDNPNVPFPAFLKAPASSGADPVPDKASKLVEK